MCSLPHTAAYTFFIEKENLIRASAEGDSIKSHAYTEMKEEIQVSGLI